MSKRILFVSDITNSFFLNSLISNLEKNGFECDYVDFDPNNIDAVEKDVAAYFLFVSKDTHIRNHATLIYLRNKCKELRRKLFLLGDQADLKDTVLAVDENDIIWNLFIRPANIGDVTNAILKNFDDLTKNDTRKSLLLIDDSGTVLHTMKQWLDPYYKVTILNSASAGLAYLGKNRPDMILLDYEMPVCDGPQMLVMLRSDANLSSIPVMFLTSKGDRESIEKVLALKPQGYLLKSLPKEKILESIDQYFAK